MIQVVNDSADTRKMLHITVEGVMVIVPTKRSSNSAAILLGLRLETTRLLLRLMNSLYLPV